MEAVATSAGGIAHQFNNALSSITGHTGLIEMEYPEDETIRDYAEAMKQSAHRMAHLTSQLLAYSKGGKYNTQTMSLARFIIDTIPVIKHMLNPDVRVETDLPSDVFAVQADPTQMQMILSAIIANSNEAMEGPGRIRISIRNVDLDQEFIKDHSGLKPGPHIYLSIEDEEPLLELFRKVLERLGYRVLQARTGKEAVEFAKTFDGQIDLALLDIKLPDMDGGRVYPLIMEARPDLKVIVCSGYSIDGPAQAILDAGAEGFIQKPFSIAPFAEELKEVLEGK